MVLLAAAVCTKGGKPLVSRQFVEMTRSRIEGVLAAFPKLLSSEKSSQKQHTFVETESVRYVYQPMDQLYVLLVTTKNSNILEDLETLRLFSRVIPEYCRNMEEKEILDNAFQLIFAFDEIIALGYRENVNLAQIRTFTDMDSHEERVYYQIKKSQEEEAKKLARDKARELAKAKQEMAKKGIRSNPMSGYGPQSAKYEPSSVSADVAPEYKPSYKPEPSRPLGPSKALRLGGRTKDVDTFVDQLKSEGQDVVSSARPTKQTVSSAAAPSLSSNVKMENVHIHTEEKITLIMSRDGGLENLEVHGIVTLRVADDKFNKVKILMDNSDKLGAQLQTHPNLDKKVFQTDAVLVLKSATKPFPVNTDVGVLKWRFQSGDDAFVPLSINCWPSESPQGCDVNIEFTLENENLELNDVVITIPLPSGAAPVVGECVGDYRYDRPKTLLEWRLPIVDRNNKQGSLEFSTASGHADNFFPVKVNFVSKQQFCDIKPTGVVQMEDDNPVKFSFETTLYAEKYEIV